MSYPGVPEAVADLAPSSKLVYVTFVLRDVSSIEEIARETRMPRSTVETALGRLEDAGVVDRRRVPGDARRLEFTLTVDAESVAASA